MIRLLTPHSKLIAIATVGIGYSLFPREKLFLESHDPHPMLSFPRTMLFSQQLKVTNSEQVNHDTKLITFAIPENQVSGLSPGSAILTQHMPKGGWFPVFRPYTPVHDLEKPGIIQLLVKKYPGGKASSYMHGLSPGEELTIRGPIPAYSWKQSTQPREVIFIAGGAGITPIYSLAKGVLAQDKQVKINLLWGVNSAQDVLLKKEIGKLKSEAGDKLQITYFVSGPKGAAEIEEARSTTPVPAEFKTGRITESALFDVGGDEKGTKIFLCGPPAMEQALAGKGGVFEKLGIKKKQVHKF